LLIGSASRVGRENHNLRLSERRLNKVAEFLKSHGASEYQIQRKAVGESLAFGPNPDNEHHRAVTVIVVAKKNKVVVKVPKTVTKSHMIEPYQYIAPGQHQFQLVVRTFIPQKRFLGFVGDGRDFSMSPNTTYRTGMFLVFDLTNGRITESLLGNSTGTRRRASDPPVYADVRVKLEKWEGDKGRILLSAHMEGSDPPLWWLQMSIPTSFLPRS
jgi:hypothetical protein